MRREMCQSRVSIYLRVEKDKNEVLKKHKLLLLMAENTQSKL